MVKIQPSAPPRKSIGGAGREESVKPMHRSHEILFLFLCRKIEGTSVIAFELLPQHNMQAVVDCVGILKER